MSTPTILNAIADPRLFRPWFRNTESWASWRSFLAALYGLPMSESELQTFQACTGRTVAPVKQAREGWLCVGRRGGKSLSLAALAVFTACFSDFRQFIVPGENLRIPVLAADRYQAQTIIGYVRGMLAIPMLKKMVVRDVSDSFELSNGVTIAIQTASFRGARGFSSPLVLCDELAFWHSEDSGSANPDTEIIRALRPSLGTIPNSMLICASSPYAKRGALHDAFKKALRRRW
jgi:phage terminase large subunit-like protein